MFHKSPIFAISNYFRIPNKDKVMVPLRPFAGQAILDLCIEAQYREGLPQRVAGYKSRQVGWSTWMLARALHRTCSTHNRRAVFLVPDEDVSAVMASHMGAMLNGLPAFLQAMRRIQNVKHIVFDNPNPKDRIENPGLNSELQITVPSPLRGIPPDLAVFSEYSHMKEAEQFAIQSSIIPGMGISPHTCAVIDTTPNGDDDFYKPLIENAVEANPKWIRTLENAPRSYTAEEILAGAIGKPDVHTYRWMVAFERWDWHEEYCHVAGTLVDTPNGLIPIEEIKVGDLTRYGVATDVFVFKSKPVLELLTANGRKMVCTGTHPIMTTDGWVRADHMLGKRAKIQGPEFSEQIVRIGSVDVTPDMGRWLGYFMSDGSVDHLSGIAFACTGTDDDVAADVAVLSEQLVRHFPAQRTKDVQAKPRRGCLYVNFQRKGLYDFLAANGMAENGKRKVCVPQCILRSPKEVVRQFLRSLFEGDGFCPKNRKHGVVLGAKSRRFLEQVQLLLLGFGITARIYQNDRTQKGTLCENYVLYMRVAESLKFIDRIGFVSKRKVARSVQYTEGHWSRNDQRIESDGFEEIISITPAGHADVYDFTVAESHAFVANGIIVHNSIRSPKFPRGQILRKPPKKYWEAFVADIGKNKKYGGEEENDLQGRYGVQIEQLYWRRQKIDDIEMPTAEMQLATFHQEFAMSIAGGFVELDKTPFDRESLDALGRMRREPSGTGLFSRNDKGVIGLMHSLGSQWHQWRLYAPPDPNEKYAMGVDTAEAYESADSDMSAVAIMRHRDRKLVALYVGKVPPHIMLEQVFLAYQFWLRPYVGVETRGSGYYLIRQLIDMGVSNYYSWKRLDKDMPEPTAFPGWQTDSRTRPQMDATFIKHLCWRHPDTNAAMPLMNIPDAQAIKQIQGIRRGDSGSLKHQHGKDDIFDAICICLMLFDDPWGDFHAQNEKKAKEQRAKKEREEFDTLFKSAMPSARSRNKPSLANL